MEEENKLKAELERTKEDLEDLETYTEEFSAFLPLAACSVNPLGVVVSVNAAFEKVIGTSALDSTGKRIEEFFVETNAIKQLLAELQKSEKFSENIQATLLSKNYGKRTVKVSASTRSDREGQFIGFFVGINDITELKDLQDRLEDKVDEQTRDLMLRAEELEKSRGEIMHVLSKIEEERNKTFSLVMNLSDGLIYTDPSGTISIINPQAEVILRVSHKEVLGTNVFDGDSTPEFQKLSSNISKDSGLEREIIEFSEDLMIEVSTITIRNENGEVVGRVIVMHDITKERALDTLKVEFISVAAHQMRTPLAAIKWAFELILASDEEKIAPELKKIAESGFESTNRILKIVNNFLDVDAVESVNMDYVFGPVNVSKVIEDVFLGIEITARERKVELVFSNEGEMLPFVQADQERLSMVFQNLIENALKYTIKEGTLTVQAHVQENSLLLSIADEGIGIPETEQQNIFSKFFRAENAKKTETDGNGLGLYTTKRIVEKHGGKIWFESKEGEGTTFFFTIPLYNKQ